MIDELTRYESYARGVKRLLLFAGLWPGRVSSKYFRLVVIFHVVANVAISSAIVNFVVHHIKNLSLATKGIAVVVSFFTIILKVLVFTLNRENLRKLHEILDRSFREDLRNEELRPVLLSPLKFFYRPTFWLTVSTWSIVTIYFFTPPISIAVQVARGADPIKYRLPFPSQYPWTVVGSGGPGVVYPMMYVAEVCAGFGLAGITAATDALFGFYIFQMSSQFRTLAHRMNNLGSSDVDCLTVVRECAERHRTIALCRDYLERIYGPIVLWMLTTSAMTMCANIFQASQISFDKAVLVMVYIIMKLMQTLLYGWYGLFLTTESEAFRESVYFSRWAGSGNRTFMSNVLILLMYKPLVLRACHFSVISLDMFIAITNTALSYFFLLRTIEEDK